MDRAPSYVSPRTTPWPWEPETGFNTTGGPPTCSRAHGTRSGSLIRTVLGIGTPSRLR